MHFSNIAREEVATVDSVEEINPIRVLASERLACAASGDLYCMCAIGSEIQTKEKPVHICFFFFLRRNANVIESEKSFNQFVARKIPEKVFSLFLFSS